MLYLLRLLKKHRKTNVISKKIKGPSLLTWSSQGGKFWPVLRGEKYNCNLIDFVKAFRKLKQFKLKKQLKIERPVKNVWGALGQPFFTIFVEACKGFLKWHYLMPWYLQL